MTDKEIERILNIIKSSKTQTITFDLNLDHEKQSEEELVNTFKNAINIDYLINEVGLIKFTQELNEVNFYSLTLKGRKVLRQGGWFKYLERQDKIEIRKEKKEDAELNITEFQARNQHLPYIVSFCGVFISIISLFITCNNSSDEPSQKKEHTLEYKLEEKKIETNENLDSDTLSLKRK